ncbi:hypothetical protein Chor_009352, partial [Crotalus horridus]
MQIVSTLQIHLQDAKGMSLRRTFVIFYPTAPPPPVQVRPKVHTGLCSLLEKTQMPQVENHVCIKLNPTEGLISLEELNCSVTLNWQDVINCCHEASRDPSEMTSKSSWTNACPVMAKLSPGQEYNVMLYRILNGSCSQEASIN